jgi:hypothetical protein
VHPHAAMYPVASDHTFLQRWAPALPRVPRPWTSLPCRGELRCCHVSHGPGPSLLTEVSSDAATCPIAPGSASLRWGPTLPRVPLLRVLLPQGESSGATTSPTAPGGLWTTRIKKSLAALGTQPGSRV